MLPFISKLDKHLAYLSGEVSTLPVCIVLHNIAHTAYCCCNSKSQVYAIIEQLFNGFTSLMFTNDGETSRSSLDTWSHLAWTQNQPLHCKAQRVKVELYYRRNSRLKDAYIGEEEKKVS